ncbi:MAG: ABC transporter substrate-binding protein [Candidatus Heimdallarchaeota archaeon]
MKNITKSITFAIIGLVVGIGGGIGIGFLIQPNNVEFDLSYGGQYYPGEFVLKGNPEYWEQYGLNVEHRLFASAKESNDALLAGQIDVNCGSDSKTVALFSSDPDNFVLIGTVQRGDRYSTIIADDAVYADWGDLVGETVATKFGSGAEQVLRRYFDTQAYEWDDFDWVDMDVTAMASALDTGQVSAFTAWEPTPSLAVDQGIGKVLRSFGDIALTPASIHANKDFAYNNPEKIVAFLAGHLEKYDLITNDVATAAADASAAAETYSTDISAGAFTLIFGKIDFTVEFNESIIESIYDTAEFMLNAGKITEVPDIVWDIRFVLAAKELQANFPTPVTSFSAGAYQQVLESIVEKHIGIPSTTKVILALTGCSAGISIFIM